MKLKEVVFPECLSSERVILRPLEKDDEESLFEIYSDEESSKYDDWYPLKTKEEARVLIEKSKISFANKKVVKYGIISKTNNKLIGCCGLFEFDEWNKKCMVFYQINRNEWNKGYATEAMKLIIEFAFETLGVNRLEAYITPGNDASVKVLEKNGFINEGLLREMEFFKNKFWDGIVMGMLKKDYMKE